MWTGGPCGGRVCPCLHSLGMSPLLGFSLSISTAGFAGPATNYKGLGQQTSPCFQHLSLGPQLAGKEVPFDVGWRHCSNGALTDGKRPLLKYQDIPEPPLTPWGDAW